MKKKFRIIYNGKYWKVQSKNKIWPFWYQYDYFYKLEDAESKFDDLTKNGTKQVVKETEWI